MFQYRGECVGAVGRETEGVVGVGRETCHRIGSVAPHHAAGMPRRVAVGNALYPPHGILISGTPLHLHRRRTQRVHPHGGSRTGGNSRRDRLSMQPHNVAVCQTRSGGVLSNIRQIGSRIPRLGHTPLGDIEVGARPAPWAIDRYKQVAEAVVVERSVEIIVVPTRGADHRVHQHLLEQGTEPHHGAQHIGHIRIGEIDGAARAAIAARCAAIKVYTRNHRLAVQLVSLHQLLGIAGPAVQVWQGGVVRHQIHGGRVANKNYICAWRLRLNPLGE